MKETEKNSRNSCKLMPQKTGKEMNEKGVTKSYSCEHVHEKLNKNNPCIATKATFEHSQLINQAGVIGPVIK